MITSVIIYLIGVILCFLLVKYIRNQVYPNTCYWILICSFISLGSWISILIIIILIIILYLYAYFDSDPPDWI